MRLLFWLVAMIKTTGSNKPQDKAIIRHPNRFEVVLSTDSLMCISRMSRHPQA